MLHAKLTKFIPLYARKCQKRFKNLKNATLYVISNIWLMFLILQFKNNNIYQKVLCAKFTAIQTKFEQLYTRKCKNRLKTLKKET